MAELHWTEAGRNAFSLVRDVALIVLLMALFFFPAAIGARLDEAGIVKGTAFGIEFQREVEEARQQSQAALEQTGEANQELQRAEAALEDAQRQIEMLGRRNPEIAAATAPIKKDLEASSRRVGEVQENIAATMERQEEVVQSQESILRRVERSRLAPEVEGTGR